MQNKLSFSTCKTSLHCSMFLHEGGSNFRVLKVSLKPAEEIAQVDKKLVIDDATKQSTGDILFDFIAKCIAEFVKEQNIKEKLPLGFTFSFAVRQTNLDSGTLIRWTKDFTATGVVDVDVVDLLREAVKRQPGVSIAVINIICVFVSYRKKL